MYKSQSIDYEKRIIELLKQRNELTDQELFTMVEYTSQVIKAICSQLAYKGIIIRVKMKGKPIVNRLISAALLQ